MNNNDYIRSAPRFFRLIGLTAALGCALLFILAGIIPAPLQEAANPVLVPNPVKSGWFLLWIQELVSWSKYWVYGVLIAGGWLVGLPWLGRQQASVQARWWPQERRVSTVLFVLLILAILLLTVLASWFRGENWELVLPWH